MTSNLYFLLSITIIVTPYSLFQSSKVRCPTIWTMIVTVFNSYIQKIRRSQEPIGSLQSIYKTTGMCGFVRTSVSEQVYWRSVDPISI